MRMHDNPPWLATIVARILLPSELRPEIEGDLLEGYSARRRDIGRRDAVRWYWRQVLVINPLVLMSRDQWRDRMADFTRQIKASPMWDDEREMMLPGELEHRSAQRRAQNGIPLPGALHEELMALARDHGLDMTLESPAEEASRNSPGTPG